MLFSQSGTLDTSFGDSGTMITSFGQLNAESNSICIQSDGKILLSGISEIDSNEDIIVVRYMSNGQLDEEFGIDGKFCLNISNFSDRCYGMALDDDDNIFLTGFTYNDNFESKGIVVKLNINGIIDSTFANNGIWISDIPDSREDFREILLQNDGKILIAGTIDFIGQSTSSAIIRLNSDGSLDSNFGQDGIASVEVPISYNPRFAKLNSNMEIVAGGFSLESTASLVMVKFDQQGDISTSFGNNGIVIENSAFDEFSRDIAIQADNKIVVATGITNNSGRDFGLTRYNNNGLIDNEFGINGRVSTDFLQTSNTAHSVLIQSDGKIILTGFLGITPNHNYAIARYDSFGTLDNSFGEEGKVITNFEFDDLAFTSELQSDGKLLCAGHSKVTGISQLSIARYLNQIETNTTNPLLSFTEIRVFPNPSTGNTSLVMELESNIKASISLIDLNGHLIEQVASFLELTKGKNVFKLDAMERLKNGLYLIKIATNEGEHYEKVMIQK